MMRSMVLAALLVCSVPNTSRPISAAVSASEMVSRSRISPTSTTSASWRTAARSASAKPCVCIPTSRCESTECSFVCTNSTGSSIVTMCRECSRLIWSIMAASVVDLPEPVGPVTSTRPCAQLGQLGDRRRQRQLVERDDLLGDHAEHRAGAVLLHEVVRAEARHALEAVREVDVARLDSNSFQWRSDATGCSSSRTFASSSARPVGHGHELAVHAHARLHARGEVQVGAALILQMAQEFVELRHQADPLRVFAVAQRLFLRDHALLHQLRERVVEQAHALRGAHLHHGAELEGLVLADQVADRLVVDEQLERRHAALAVRRRHQPLRDHRPQRLRHHAADLVLLVGREHAHDPVDGADRVLVWSVASTRWPVSAAVSASEIVSRSRSSPITITSGSSRSAARSARANEPVCAAHRCAGSPRSASAGARTRSDPRR